MVGLKPKGNGHQGQGIRFSCCYRTTKERPLGERLPLGPKELLEGPIHLAAQPIGNGNDLALELGRCSGEGQSGQGGWL